MNINSILKSPSTGLAIGMFLSGTVGLFAVVTGQPTFNIVLFRCLFGAITLFGWAWATQGRRAFEGLETAGFRLVFFSGALLVINWLTIFEAFHRTSIGFATIIYHLQPFWIIIVGSLALGESIKGAKFQWLIVGFSGLILTVLPKIGDIQADPDWLIGLFCALVASIFYAAAALTTRAVKGVRPDILSGCHCLIGIVLFIPFMNLPALLVTNIQTWTSLAVIGVVHTGLAYVLIYSAYPKVPIIVIAIATFLNPAAALVIDYLAFNQTISIEQAIGLVFIMLAGLAINLGWRPPLPFRS